MSLKRLNIFVVVSMIHLSLITLINWIHLKCITLKKWLKYLSWMMDSVMFSDVHVFMCSVMFMCSCVHFSTKWGIRNNLKALRGETNTIYGFMMNSNDFSLIQKCCSWIHISQSIIYSINYLNLTQFFLLIKCQFVKLIILNLHLYVGKNYVILI